MEKVQEEENIKIDLRITEETQKTQCYECETKNPLEKYINDFIDEFKLKLSSLYVLYDGKCLFGKELKKPISKIISKIDKENKKMALLLRGNSVFDIHEQDEIKIILSIEPSQTPELKGIKGQTIKEIIKEKFIIKIDLKWCIFKYKENEIDINKKFDDIANNEDKRRSTIIITLNFTIPLIVHYIRKNKNKSLSIPCKLNDWVDIYFTKTNRVKYDYNLFYKGKNIVNYKVFFELISEELIQDKLTKANIYNTENCFKTSDNIKKTNETMINLNEKINGIPTSVFPSNKKNDEKLEIEIKVIKKCCCVIYKRKISNCCDKFKDKYKHCLGYLAGFLLVIIVLALIFYVYGGWIIFLHI